MVDLLSDLRLGGRLLVKNPGYGLFVAFTLALAIGANAIIFGLTDLILLRPLPLGDPARVVFVYSVNARQGVERARASLPDFLDWRAQAGSFEQMAAFGGAPYTWSGPGEPLRLSGLRATANLFGMWELKPVLGRTFLPGEDAPGAPRVAVLSHRFWTTHLDAARDVIGRPMTLNGEPYTIVGVLTPEIEVGNFQPIDLWVPLNLDVAGARRDDRWLRVAARLRPGGTLASAATELAAIGRRLEAAYPDANEGWSVRPLKLREAIVGSGAGLILSLLTIVVAFVLIVACANVANMMLARATVRQREMAIRVAIGASRSRLVRQLVSESLLLGMVAGLLGLLVAQGGMRLIQATSEDWIFRNLTISRNVVTFTVALSVLTPLLFSLLPALHASRADLNAALKEGGQRTSGGPRGRRSRAVLVVSQLSLALMLLVVASLAARTVAAIEHEPPGIQTSNILTVNVNLDPPQYRDVVQVVPFSRQVIDRLAALPGVRSAAAASRLPLVATEPTTRFRIEGRSTAGPLAKDLPWANYVSITPEYLQTFDLHLVAGRALSSRDHAAAPFVALVSREAVRRYWPETSPIGQHIELAGSEAGAAAASTIRSRIEIVGVVDDVKPNDPTDSMPPRIYRPLAQHPERAVAFVVRADANAAALAPAVREVLRGADSTLAVSEMRTLESVVREQFAENYILVGLFSSFAVLALVLAGAGLYGVTAYSVSQRTQEIGIRMALGASRRDVLSLVLAQNARLVGTGAVIGIGGGAVLGRAMRSILYRVGVTDPVTFGGVLIVVTAVALVASYVPARRASRVDPLTALHDN